MQCSSRTRPCNRPNQGGRRRRFTLDRLIGIGEGASTVFDYYKTPDELAMRYRDHSRYGRLDPAHRLPSAIGE